MQPIVKKILVIGTIGLGIAAYIAYQKAMKIKAIFEGMEIEPAGVSSFDLNIKEARLSFDLDIKLINNSPDDLFITGVSVANLKKVILYYNGFYLGEAEVEINEISIPSRNSLIVKNVPVRASIYNLLSNISSLYNFKFENLNIIGVVEALGKEYQISN